MLQICCKNNNISKNFPIGSSLLDIYNGFNLDIPYGLVSAKVNNKVEGLNYRAYNNKDVEFLIYAKSFGNAHLCPFTLLHLVQSGGGPIP